MEPASAEVSTTGSYKPHLWAGESCDDVREFADPALRAALDGFLVGLVWDGGGVGEVVGVPE
ncbi:hypothetical protein [Streptomyces olivochromogenes]|uniref:hypothetical protein n=1 Tax=Streptomyces olivochromogenes TaxID=1963 RepID=UPI001F2789AE|nr:hypothetical protein [Streptomyces olivochromogenes]MCF3130024.1 hypothetical protein [Streptomyces olivochromogenes]